MDQRRDDLARWAADAIRRYTSSNANNNIAASPEGDASPLENAVESAADSSSAQMEFTVTMVSGDASFRRYFRLQHKDFSWIAVDAPADKEDNPRFVAIAKAWRDHEVAVPRVIDYDFERGFMLLEDFGDRLLWPALHRDDITLSEVSDYYRQAIRQLLHIQTMPVKNLPVYDAELLDREMALFPDWLCQQQLGMELSGAEQDMLQSVFTTLRERALAQRQVVVHRDFHSRNLMLRDDGSLGVIDFQDAVAGPATYDLISLLRDSYVRWPQALVDELAAEYWEAARPLGVYLDSWEEFQRDFDWVSMQRHLKVAGIFARLNLRDGKPGYLADIPNTCQYLQEICSRYDEFEAFSQWLEKRFMPALASLNALIPPAGTEALRDSSAE
ncbi:MAG: aminoglycoside phosphotransferase [Oceanospirillaceae bacterium]|uniref:aminoglycoside phosphotransferase family protein n=1 Tax=unclassified Thalassolituus TaxID=2624967 RepID=UPI000C09AE34|nr:MULTISPECIES: phosphotransferase [unclassified Thalassolituus]MAK90309.1 aminoglycoside phosphotransferase [Thalassolituus sp.]MAS24623.1 aminoglycoside phosphotransferase [Oceanospirillaceae bacterium]MAX97608.1 aminoglycoside phosphotransferase [Oceanospirillaceae bacterium]MBS52598.1 aminoglycoside phosphotransferase [Oceanospirillaceae bacterium]|tara:strand:+ start:71 stop:1228 length:1158 start_codon:yes stop_codon:yes gene_type:complete